MLAFFSIIFLVIYFFSVNIIFKISLSFKEDCGDLTNLVVSYLFLLFFWLCFSYFACCIMVTEDIK